MVARGSSTAFEGEVGVRGPLTELVRQVLRDGGVETRGRTLLLVRRRPGAGGIAAQGDTEPTPISHSGDACLLTLPTKRAGVSGSEMRTRMRGLVDSQSGSLHVGRRLGHGRVSRTVSIC